MRRQRSGITIRRTGLMVSELIFLLLIIGVLGVLTLSALFQMHRADRPSDAGSPLAVHQASY